MTVASLRTVDLDPRVWQALSARAADPGAAVSAIAEDGWSDGARAAFDLYAPLAVAPGTPLVVGQVGQSLDGRVATIAGDARDISCREGIDHLHRLRALVDAVIVGVGTVHNDDPRLSVRHVDGVDPARVVIDGRGRVPAGARIFRPDGARRIVIQSGDTPRPDGVEVVRLTSRGGDLDPRDILAALRERGLCRILVEGGAATLSHFIGAGLIDRLHVSIAPLIIGAGPSGLALPPVVTLREAIRPETRAYQLGTDILYDCNLRRRAEFAAAAE